LQYGVPLKDHVKSYISMTFAPSGITDDSDIRTASSLVDYMFRRLALSYLSFDDRLELGLASIDDMPEEQTTLLDVSPAETEPESVSPPAPVARGEHANPAVASVEPSPAVSQTPVAKAEKAKTVITDAAAPLCYNCGNQTQRAGSCYVCSSCGSTTGCS
jgi:ribonucleoside-diphosphate reductase alpha chain